MNSLVGKVEEMEPVPSKRRLKIVHLNNDCLEKVFSYLNHQELTNVAESNIHLAISAENLFKIKFKEIEYDCFDRNFNDETFFITLERFGKYVQKLRITFRWDRIRDQSIVDAVMNNCSGTITELIFSNAQQFMILSREFPKLQKFELIDCTNGIDKSMVQLDVWFPNLRSLSICNVTNFWAIFRIKRYASLEHFGFRECPENASYEYRSGIWNFFAENFQLKGLALDDSREYKNDVFKRKQAFHNIECLDVVSPYPFPIQFECPNLRELKIAFYADKSDIFNKLPSSIERFQLTIPAVPVSGLDFILGCFNQLKALSLIISKLLDVQQMEKLAIEMQTLIDFEICMNNAIFETKKFAGLEHFFQHSKKLKTIRLKFEINTFKYTDSIYKTEVENARKFLQRMNEGGKSKWCMRHRLIENDQYRARQLFTFPFLLLSFKKIGY